MAERLGRWRSERGYRRRVRRRVEAAIDAVPVPEPFDLLEYLHRLEVQRGRPIRLYPIPPGLPQVPFALWLPDDDHQVDRIFVAMKITTWHRDRCVLHECGHMLLGHRPRGETRCDYPWLEQLFSHLDPEAVWSVLMSRDLFDGEQEREAELFANLMAARFMRRTAAPAASGTAEDAAVLARLARALGDPQA